MKTFLKRMSYYIEESSSWAARGGIVGFLTAILLVWLDLAKQVPIFGSVIQSDTAIAFGVGFVIYLVPIVIFGFCYDSSWFVQVLVLSALIWFIVWQGVAGILRMEISFVRFIAPYLVSSLTGFLVGGVAAGGLSVLFQAIRRVVPSEGSKHSALMQVYYLVWFTRWLSIILFIGGLAPHVLLLVVFLAGGKSDTVLERLTNLDPESHDLRPIWWGMVIAGILWLGLALFLETKLFRRMNTTERRQIPD